MTTVKVETSPFAMFPAQADYSNHDWEKQDALAVLAGQADSVEGLRAVALMLELIEPPTVEEDVEPEPTFCGLGHDQAEHGATTKTGGTYCGACKVAQTKERNPVNPAGSIRRLRHLILNGHTQASLARMTGLSVATISRIALAKVRNVSQINADAIRRAFEDKRDVFLNTPIHHKHVELQKNWVWAELYEDIDDPLAEPVIPKRVAA